MEVSGLGNPCRIPLANTMGTSSVPDQGENGVQTLIYHELFRHYVRKSLVRRHSLMRTPDFSRIKESTQFAIGPPTNQLVSRPRI